MFDKGRLRHSFFCFTSRHSFMRTKQDFSGDRDGGCCGGMWVGILKN